MLVNACDLHRTDLFFHRKSLYRISSFFFIELHSTNNKENKVFKSFLQCHINKVPFIELLTLCFSRLFIHKYF